MKLGINIQPIERAFEAMLSAIDAYFEPKENNEKKILYVMPALVLFIVSYYAIFPIVDEMLETKSGELSTANSALNENLVFIRVIDNDGGMVRKYAELDEVKLRLANADARVKKAEATLGEVYAMSQAWYFTLDFATNEAMRLGLNISDSEFKKSEVHGVGGLEKSFMGLKGSGSKLSLFEYMYSIERGMGHGGKFVSLERVSIRPKGDRLDFELLIGNQKGSL